MEENLKLYDELKGTNGFKAGFVPCPPATGRVFKIGLPIERLGYDIPRIKEVAVHIFLDENSAIGSHSHKNEEEAEVYFVSRKKDLDNGSVEPFENQGVAGKETRFQSHSVSFSEIDASPSTHKHVVLDSTLDIVFGGKVNQANGTDLEGMIDIYGIKSLVDNLDLHVYSESGKTHITSKGEEIVLGFDENNHYTDFTLPNQQYYAKFSNFIEKSKQPEEVQL